MRIKLGFLLSTLVSLSYSQILYLTDEITGKPVADAYIYHENQSAISQSNARGEVLLKGFPQGTLHIQHPTYYHFSIEYVGDELSVKLKEKIISFDEIIVSANKWEQQQENISREIIVIGKKEIAFENPQTPADLLASSAQVFVQKSQLGGGSPKLRGFAANGVLLVVDGVRMNNAIFRGGNLQNIINIDVNAIESTEVVFGPESVIYGSDALGGVMDFHTIDPKLSDESTIVNGNGLLRYSSAANEKTGHLDFSISKRKFSIFHSASFTAFDDLKAGAYRTEKLKGEFERKFYAQRINGEDQLIANSDVNLQRFSGYNLFNTITKAKFRVSESLHLSYGFYYSTTSEIPRYDRLTEPIAEDSDSLVNAEWYYGPQHWQMHRLQASHYKENSFYNQLRIIGAFQQFEESRNDRKFGSNQLRTQQEKVALYSLSIDLDKELGKGDLFYGIDYYHNDVLSVAFSRNIVTNNESSASPRYPDGGSSYLSGAVYASYVHRPDESLSLNGGLRFNYVGLQATSLSEDAALLNSKNMELNNHALTWSVGMVYHVNPTHIFRYNISTGFRAPNIDDVGKLFELNEEVLIVPNPGLKPEHTLSNEIGYEMKSDRTQISITGFYSRLRYAIGRGKYSLGDSVAWNGKSIRAQINAGKTDIYGGSLAVQAEISQSFAIKSAISYTDGKDLTNNQPIRHATPLFGRTTFIYQKNRLRTELYIEYNSAKKPSQIPDSEFADKTYLYANSGSPTWYTLNLKGSYQLNKHFSVNAGIENILDHHYRPYTSGISAPGRNFIIAVRGSI